MEKFHFPVLIPHRHLAGAKTNKEWQKLPRKCPPIESKRKQTSSAAGKNLPTLTTPEELWQNKISMEKPLPEKQKKNKQKKKSKKIRRNVCVNISFHLTRRIGVGCLLAGFHHPSTALILKWENLFFISRSYLLLVAFFCSLLSL